MSNLSEQRVFRVAVNGLPHFCRKLSQLVDGDGWEVPYRSPFHPVGLAARFIDLARCHLAYSWMGRISMGKFLRTAHALGKTKVIILWCGTDALYAKQELSQGKMNPWVRDRVHWAVSPWLAEEVRALGIHCEYVQTSFVESVSPAPLPEKFSVLVYAPSLKKAELYGVDSILEVAKKLHTIEFKLVGLQERSIPDCPSNLHVFGHTVLDRFYREATVLWRPVRHDGLSFMVLEALAHGRHVIYSYPFPGCVHAPGPDAACRELERLRELHSSRTLTLNENGRQVVRQDFDPQVVRARLLSRWKEIILAPVGELSGSRAQVPSRTS
jgi:glycosyltransferase involved in cell wall biosynthesis